MIEAQLTTLRDLPIVRREDAWWIEPADAIAGERVGPYATKREAEEDRRGLVRFLNRQARGLNPFL